MAIDTSLLVMAPVLQDYLVDKDTGASLSGGVVTLYEDTQRQTLKNWYYQTGTVGNYIFVPLDNPLTLSSVGTITDPNGNDVIPFYYPYDENNSSTIQPYFITVYNSNGELQFTRENFPFVPATTPIPTNEVSTLNNLIANNVFYHNFGSMTFGTTTPPVGTNVIIAPSQHDGFMAANFNVTGAPLGGNDWRFIKDSTDNTDVLTFTKFPQNLQPAFRNDIRPEYFLKVECTATGTAGTVKSIRVPISLHIQTLENQPFTFTIWCQNPGGSTNTQITCRLLQYLGTGGAAPIFYSIGTTGIITVPTAWTKVIISGIFPPSVPVSNAGDDAWYLDILFPLNSTFSINIALPSIYLGSIIPTNYFQTYDQIDTIINSWRTGDTRTSSNDFAPFGWVLCNDGVLSNSGSITAPVNIPVARANQDCWNLYSLLWNSTNTVVCPLFPPSGGTVPIARGASAYFDWNSNNQLQLTRILGKSLLGLPPTSSLTGYSSITFNGGKPAWQPVMANVGFFGTSIFLETLWYVGAPVYLTTDSSGFVPVNYAINTIYYVIPSIDGSQPQQIQLATTYQNALAGNNLQSSGPPGNCIINFALGAGNNDVSLSSFGESRHKQLSSEVGLHSHFDVVNTGTMPPRAYTTGPLGSKDVGPIPISPNVPPALPTVGYNVGGVPFNIVQPSTYLNVFLKL